MSIIYDKKLGHNIEVKADQLEEYLSLKSDRYIPAEDETYTIVDIDTGKYERVKGGVLSKKLSNRNQLVPNEDAAVDGILSSAWEEAKDFSTGFVDEAYGLNIMRLMPLPTDPVKRAKEIERRDSLTTKAGEITGLVAPFLIHPVLGAAKVAAKSALKKGLKKGLGVLSKAPSAQVIRGADAVGRSAAGLVGKAGGGKLAQGAARALGQGTTLAAVSESVKAVGRGLASSEEGPKTFEEEETRRKMDSGIGEGLRSFGENALATSVLIGGLGVAGKALKSGAELALKGGKLAAKGAGWLAGTPTSIEGFRRSFFNVKKPEAFVRLRKAMGMVDKKKYSDDKVLSEASKLTKKIFGDAPIKTRRDLISRFDYVKENARKRLNMLRLDVESLRKRPKTHRALKDLLFKNLDDLAKSVPEARRTTTLKPFYSHIDALMKMVKNKRSLTFGDIKHIRDEFRDKARFSAQTSSETMELYRKAYQTFTKLENKTLGTTLTRWTERGFDAAKADRLVRDFEKNKKLVSQVTEMADLLRKNPSVAYALGHHVVQSGLVGIFGYQALGLAGVAGAYALSKGAHSFAKSGYRHLQIADLMEKQVAFNRKYLGANGIKSVFNGSASLKNVKDIDVKTLSRLLVGREYSRLEDVVDEVASQAPEDAYVGMEDIYATADKYGGDSNSTAYNSKAVDAKALIKSIMPRKLLDLTGRGVIPKTDKDAFMSELSMSLSPQHFIRAVRNKTLTRKAYQNFSRLYPDFISKFNAGVVTQLREGVITHSQADQYLSIIKDSSTKDLIWTRLSANDKVKNERNKMPKRKLRRTQPTASELSVGGY